MDEHHVSVKNIRNCLCSNVNDTGIIVAIGNLIALQTKQQNQLEHDGPIQLHTFSPDFQTEEFLTEIEDVPNSTYGGLKLCNNSDKEKMYGDPGIILEKRPTMFSLDYIFHDRYTTKSNNTIRIRVFASQDVDCATIINDVLIFTTSVGFVPGTYTFPNQPYQEGLSIIQHSIDINTIYITEDGQSWNWIYFRLVFNVLVCFITQKIVRFIHKMSKETPQYCFTCRSIKTYICNPSLISTNTPLTDLLIIYLLKRALFRKVFIIGSNYVATYTMLHMFYATTHLIDMNQVTTISVYFGVLLIIIFILECFSNLMGKSVKLLPETIEPFKSSILYLCLSFWLLLDSILRVQNPRERDSPSLFIFYLYARWELIIFRYLLFIVDQISSLLQILFSIYHGFVILMLPIQVWVPLIILFISYLKDVLHEYIKVYQDCLKVVVEVIEGKKRIQIKDEKVAILVGGNSNKIDFTNGNRKISSPLMLFYNRGNIQITPDFFYKVREILEEVLESPLSIHKIFYDEFLSLVFRMIPIFFTILVLKMSNFSLNNFEPVQQFLVGLLLYSLYSKIGLQRAAPNDISSNRYLKSKIKVLVNKHMDTFDVTDSEDQDIDNPVRPNGLAIAVVVSSYIIGIIYVFYMLGINVSQMNLIPVQLHRYFRNSDILVLHNVFFIIFLIHIVLLYYCM